MKYIRELGYFTALEVLQSRIYKILLLVCTLVPLTGIIFSNLFLVDLGKVYMDVMTGGAHLLALIFVLFLAAPLLARDIDQRICYILLIPPIQRWQYLCGRFAGLTIAFIVLMMVLTLCGLIGTWLFIDSNYAMHQSDITALSVPLLVFFIFFQHISLIGLLFFFFSWATGTAEIMVFTIAAAIFAWIFPPILQALQDPEVARQIPEWLQALLQAFYQMLPHLNGGDIALALAHGERIEMLATLAYCTEHLSYAIIALLLAIIAFRHRDL